ncbi:RNA-directed DNA polymerase (Reverse transcriptase), Ribonuclease H-like protein [Gossypium australe]|uniref:RNA-directed DNA polymerase (Reverse transcriptase), Ribonuclease H-like protein n=1 Tax=Gossypium australe TaxID=47621 RepID=A0A5B6UX63_9ROSI|nr:RNA-directed DNA polymerase (Reverse transcriptase), Ribonuclease H-like protein [Gossypium australe]
MMGNRSINAISEEGVGRENLSGICPYEPGSVLNNWTAEEIPVVFRADSKHVCCFKPRSNKNPFRGYHDFEDDRDCNLSLDLLRMVEQEEKHILPHKETIKIMILEEGKEVKIGTCIAEETKRDLIELLQEFKYVFAWLYQDMPRLSNDIMVHRLPTKEECKPVQQKLRRMRPDVVIKIKEEVKKQFDAGDLNKASPKDNFPLPHIETLVYNMAGYSLVSFMDDFSRYNQINMHPKDMEKTTFVTLWGTFYYKLMPFELKNVRATYQRAIVTLFHDMMHKEIEVYVDNMIAKSQTEKEHVQVLRKLFLRLKKFQLKLNPTKCTFGARSGKLLGFVVSEKGIEIGPDKVKAIQELPPPCTQKKVQGFLGRLNYIARFISQLTEKCDPIFRLLKKHIPGVWDDECQKTFDKVKQYLSNTLVLLPPSSYRPLILYLTVFDNSMRYVLGQHNVTGKKERAIYYLRSAIADFLASRALEDYEPLNFDFPNEDLIYAATTEEDTPEDCPWKLIFDGASNIIGN